jgi:hypothetical protein
MCVLSDLVKDAVELDGMEVANVAHDEQMMAGARRAYIVRAGLFALVYWHACALATAKLQQELVEQRGVDSSGGGAV